MAVGYLNFNTLHTVVELTDLIATHYGAHIWNIRTVKDRDNGVVVGKGPYKGDDVYTEGAATAFEGVVRETTASGRYLIEVTKADGAILLAQPEENYYEFETAAKAPSQFYNAQGDVVRGYSLTVGDRFAVSKEGFTTVPSKETIGKTVTADADTKKFVIGA